MIKTFKLTNLDLADYIQKTLCWPIDLYDREITLDVDYKVYGRYYPQTNFEPAEYPEIEVQDIEEFIIELDTSSYLLHEKQIALLQDKLLEVLADKIETACWEDYEDYYD